jgi:hypothetical protein
MKCHRCSSTLAILAAVQRRAAVSIQDQQIAVIEYRHGKVVHMREWAFDPTVLESLSSSAAAAA